MTENFKSIVFSLHLLIIFTTHYYLNTSSFFEMLDNSIYKFSLFNRYLLGISDFHLVFFVNY